MLDFGDVTIDSEIEIENNNVVDILWG